MSSYMARKFKKDFETGAPFWTGDNGLLMSIVIVRRDDWAEVIRKYFSHYLREKIVPGRAKERYAFRDRVEPDDDFAGCRRCWRTRDKPTPYPVIEYELKRPY